MGSLDSEERKLLFSLAERSSLAYTEPGYVLFQREGTLFAQPFDADQLELTGDPIRIADDVSVTPGGDAAFDVSSSGVLVYRTAAIDARATSQLVWFDRMGKRLESVGEPGTYSSLDLSPDGKQVAVSRVGDP